MDDPDYQMALNLQRMYQQESQSHSSSDQHFARKLQAEFEQEVILENPTNNLVYTKNTNKDNTKSLVDPSWELVDPTPNIYNLFLAFNQQFFWNKLLAVCVEWSKRMTTCAGICSYTGREGMCKIALSEPLLKLRPRKDLIETLLHEMIHAYLFVTHNNRDRDGHGPEFHKHMYRINNEAGTNISVYHSFHDEVNLYKTHWWKCTGPCVSRKPYYGIIRRATNRAPGPRDFWWGEHSRNCGGKFVKIKEPEKPEKKKKSEKENIKPTSKLQNQPSIKSFLPTSKSIPVAKPTQNWTPKQPNSTITQPTSNAMIPRTNIHGFGSTSTSSSNNKIFNNNANIKNIHGFHDIDKISQKTPTKTGAVSPQNGNRFYGGGVPLNASTSSKSPKTDLSVVRNHWLDKFENKNKVPSKKRVSDEMIQNTPKRKQNMAKCPNCNTKVEESQINEHLDICLNLTETCNYCNEEINALEIDKHKLTCPKKSETKKSQELIECHICCEFFDSNEIEKHLETCLQNISMSFDTSKDFKECEICKSNIDETIYTTHVAGCLVKFYDEIENGLKSPEKVSCLVCKKFVPKDSLNNHLEDCMSDTFFENKDDVEDFFNDNSLIEEYKRDVSCSILISDDSEVFDNDYERNSFINDNSLMEDYENSFTS